MELAKLSANLRSPLEFLDRHPVIVAPSTSVGDAIALMRLARNTCPLLDSNATVKTSISCALVVDRNQLVGLLNPRDVLNLVAESGWQEMKVVDAMTRNLIILKESEFTDIFTAFKLFCQHSIDWLPIVDEQGQLIGLVSEEKIRPEIYSLVEILHQEVVTLQQKQRELLESQSEIEKQVSDRQNAENALRQSELEQRVQQRTEHYEQAVLTGKLTAEKLQNSETQLLALFNAMTDIVLVFDASGRYLKIAPSAPELLYKPAPEVLGKTLAEMLPEAEANFALGHIRQTLASGETHRVEYSMEIGGKVIWFDGNISPLGVDRVMWVARDITARKHAEAALQKSEEKFRNLFDDAPIAIGLASVRDYCMIKVNEAHRQMLGYSDADWEAMSFADVTHPEDLQADLEQVKQLVDGNIPRFQMEKRLIKKNGELMWANLTVTLIRDSDGLPLYSMAAIEDITDRKRAEMELQQLKERLQFLLASNPAVIFTAAPAGNFCTTYISDNVQAIVGYDPQEVLADPNFWSSRIHPEDRSQFIVNFSDLSEVKNCICESRFLHRDGLYRWLRTELKLLVDSRGFALEIIGYAADISNSKCAEIALRQQFEQERLLEAIARRVRQSLQLEEILNTTVAELQQVLLADRVLVYQILPKSGGKVIAEAVAEGCSPLVDIFFGEEVFPAESYQLYLQGRICAISELDDPSITPCMVEFMKEIEVRAKLVVPIIQHSQLWGLLVAHQCDGPREWQEWEMNLFQQLVNQLAIAIQQSLLYQQLQAELSDRKQAEANLKISLKEKEILLKEIHHRVKNNLCVVASLLELQSNTVADPQLAKMFEESQNRLYSMALIHEKLYRSTNLAEINFGEYLEDLVTNLFHSYNISDNRIQLRVLAEPIALNLETATPCGLIANELVSNTLKHAFPDGANGTVSVECYQTGDREIHLFVKDNGIGFPQNLDFRKTNSMGFQVVCTLTEQLEGSIELSKQTGTAFHLKFNELKYSHRF